MKKRILAVALAGTVCLTATLAGANGDEEAPPPDLSRPVSAVPGRPLPFPVKDETQAVAPALTGPKALPVDPAELSLSSFANGTKHDTTLGYSLEEFQGLVIRQSKVERGKVTLPPASVGYVIEATPGIAPLGQDALIFASGPKFLVDYELSVVFRKDVTIGAGDSVVLGSTAVRYASPLPFSGTLAAGMATESLAGFAYGQNGAGTFEVSVTQPGWRPKVFHHGLNQGQPVEVTPKQVKFAWLSSLRVDSLVFADKVERGGKMKSGEEVAVGTGKVKVTGVTPMRTVTLDTPDGAKTLSAPPDPNILPEDTESRKKLVVVGKEFAVVLNPKLSDFTKGEAQLFVYSGLHTYRNGEALEGASDFRVWPCAVTNGNVIGLLITNDKPIELDPKKTSFDGPDGAFKLVTGWTEGGELRSFRLEHGETKSAEVSAKGRSSIDLVAGTGPTIASVAARVRKSAPSGEPSEARDGGAAPAPSASAAPVSEPSFKDDPVAYARPHLYWALGGVSAGLVLAALIALLRRKPRQPWE